MKLSLNTNIGSLKAQNQLLKANERLSTSFERLSSGLRINRASDDPAGLVMASSLQTDSRLMAQAVRNVNDGISFLNVAEAALGEMSNIAIRLQELAIQAANGALGVSQRVALDKEADGLVEEYNRIVTTVHFNQISIFDGSTQSIALQVGPEGSAQISFAVNEELSRTVGDGTFDAGITYTVATGVQSRLVEEADLDSDGDLDLVVANSSDDQIGVLLNNGDGTFDSVATYTAGDNTMAVKLADFDNDGITDIAAMNMASANYSIFIGVGNGTFGAQSSFSIGGGMRFTMTVGDVNNDGNIDLVSANSGQGHFSVNLGRGDGTFAAEVTFASASTPYDVVLGDVNNDGNLDYIGSDRFADEVIVALGRGDGSFDSEHIFSIGSGASGVNKISLADLNDDGALDIVGSIANGDIGVVMGRGDGTFDSLTVFSTGDGSFALSLEDLNGDGLHDLATAGYSTNKGKIYLGCGDGTFTMAFSFDTTANPVDFAVGDFNMDGAIDFALTDFGTSFMQVNLGKTTEVSTLPYLSLTTTTGARLAGGIAESALQRIVSELGSIGAAQSRLSHTVNHLQVMRENYAAANSKIVDADIAEEVAQMVRQQILQQAVTAVMAQANQQPALVLELLK